MNTVELAQGRGADVVISGAGPNGLMIACELALGGVRPIVLEQLPEPSAEPKANGLVGQVVRMLDMCGLYHEFGGAPGAPLPLPAWAFSGIPVVIRRCGRQPDVFAADPATVPRH